MQTIRLTFGKNAINNHFEAPNYPGGNGWKLSEGYLQMAWMTHIPAPNS